MLPEQTAVGPHGLGPPQQAWPTEPQLTQTPPEQVWKGAKHVLPKQHG